MAAPGAAAAADAAADDDSIEVVPSGAALSKVSEWLGQSAEALLQQSDAAVEAMFDTPHPQLLGLGAKHLSHKTMQQSGVELKLRHRLKKSADAATAGNGAYQPAQLLRHQQHKRRRAEAAGGQPQQQQRQDSDSDEDGRGKLGRPKAPPPQQQQQQQQPGKQRSAAAAAGAAVLPGPGRKTFDRSELLAVPLQYLSKHQRKQLNKKAKKQQQQQQQQGGGS